MDDILIPIVVDDRTDAALRSAAMRIKELGASTRGADVGFARLGDVMKRSGAATGAFISQVKGLVAAWLGIHGALRGVQQVAAFEKQMILLKAVTGETALAMEAMEAKARELGVTTVFSAQQAAEGMVLLAKAGLSVGQSMEVVPTVLNLAAAAMISADQASGILVNTMKQFGIAADESARVADSLVVVANATTTEVTQLAQAMKFAGVAASVLGISLETTSAALGVLAENGLQAELGGTGLRAVLAGLAVRSKEGERALASLGLTYADVSLETNTLAEAMAKLQKAGMGVEAAFELFDRRGGTAALILARHSAAIDELAERQRKLAGTTKSFGEAMQQGLSGAMARFGNVVREAALQVGRGGLGDALTATLIVGRDAIGMLFGLEASAQDAANASSALALSISAVVGALAGLTSIKLLGWIGSATAAMLAFARAHPIVAIGTLAGALTGLVLGLNKVSPASRAAAASLQGFTRTVESLELQMEGLGDLDIRINIAREAKDAERELSLLGERMHRAKLVAEDIKVLIAQGFGPAAVKRIAEVSAAFKLPDLKMPDWARLMAPGIRSAEDLQKHIKAIETELARVRPPAVTALFPVDSQVLARMKDELGLLHQAAKAMGGSAADVVEPTITKLQKQISDMQERMKLLRSTLTVLPGDTDADEIQRRREMADALDHEAQRRAEARRQIAETVMSIEEEITLLTASKGVRRALVDEFDAERQRREMVATAQKAGLALTDDELAKIDEVIARLKERRKAERDQFGGVAEAFGFDPEEARAMGGAWASVFTDAIVASLGDSGVAEAFQDLGENARDLFIGQMSAEAFSPLTEVMGTIAKAAATPFRMLSELVVQQVLGPIGQALAGVLGLTETAGAATATSMGATATAATEGALAMGAMAMATQAVAIASDASATGMTATAIGAAAAAKATAVSVIPAKAFAAGIGSAGVAAGVTAGAIGVMGKAMVGAITAAAVAAAGAFGATVLEMGAVLAVSTPAAVAASIATLGGALAFGPMAIAQIKAAAATALIPLAEGGLVMPRRGGVPVIVAEAGEAELVLPLSKATEWIERHGPALGIMPGKDRRVTGAIAAHVPPPVGRERPERGIEGPPPLPLPTSRNQVPMMTAALQLAEDMPGGARQSMKMSEQLRKLETFDRLVDRRDSAITTVRELDRMRESTSDRRSEVVVDRAATERSISERIESAVRERVDRLRTDRTFASLHAFRSSERFRQAATSDRTTREIVPRGTAGTDRVMERVERSRLERDRAARFADRVERTRIVEAGATVPIMASQRPGPRFVEAAERGGRRPTAPGAPLTAPAGLSAGERARLGAPANAGERSAHAILASVEGIGPPVAVGEPLDLSRARRPGMSSTAPAAAAGPDMVARARPPHDVVTTLPQAMERAGVRLDVAIDIDRGIHPAFPAPVLEAGGLAGAAAPVQLPGVAPPRTRPPDQGRKLATQWEQRPPTTWLPQDSVVQRPIAATVPTSGLGSPRPLGPLLSRLMPDDEPELIGAGEEVTMPAEHIVPRQAAGHDDELVTKPLPSRRPPQPASILGVKELTAAMRRARGQHAQEPLQRTRPRSADPSRSPMPSIGMLGRLAPTAEPEMAFETGAPFGGGRAAVQAVVENSPPVMIQTGPLLEIGTVNAANPRQFVDTVLDMLRARLREAGLGNASILG